MALSPSVPATSPLARQLLRYVSSGLVAALNRPAPTISLPSAAAQAAEDVAASQRRLRPAPSTPRRPGAPRQGRGGSGGQVHAAPAMPRVVMRGGPSPPSRPAEGSGGKTHAVSPAAATTTMRVVMRGPAPPGSPAEGAGGSGGSHH